MKARPVFSLDRRCSAALRRIAAFIEDRAAAARADTAAAFEEARRAQQQAHSQTAGDAR